MTENEAHPGPWLASVDADVVERMESALYTLHHADDPLLVVRTMADLRGVGDTLTDRAVNDARRAGASWQQIAEALRTSRQSAHARFAHDESE